MTFLNVCAKLNLAHYQLKRRKTMSAEKPDSEQKLEVNLYSLLNISEDTSWDKATDKLAKEYNDLLTKRNTLGLASEEGNRFDQMQYIYDYLNFRPGQKIPSSALERYFKKDVSIKITPKQEDSGIKIIPRKIGEIKITPTKKDD